MRHRSRLASLPSLALGLLAAISLGCGADCSDNQCAGGLEWLGDARSGTLLPGTYAFEVELDGTRLAFECEVAETATSSECGEVTRLEGDGDFELEAFVQRADAGLPRPGDHAGRIVLRANEPVAGGVRGPELVRIQAERDGLPIVDESYELTYERDEAYHGDEACGFCDLTQTRMYELE
jgi:hypothetical protein